jgi:hypothetical protein
MLLLAHPQQLFPQHPFCLSDDALRKLAESL